MLRHRALPLPLLLLLTLALGGLLLPAVGHAADSYSGMGSASYKKKKQAMNARQDAIDAAIVDALRKALPDFIGAEALAAKAEVVEGQLLPLAAGLIKGYEVVSEKDRDKTYSVVVKIVVDQEALKSNLDGLGFSMDVGSRKSIGVVIDEYFQADLAPSSEPLIARSIDMSSVNYSLEHDVAADMDAGSSSSNTSNVHDSGSSRDSYGGALGHASGSSKSTYKDTSSGESEAHESASYAESLDENYSEFALSMTEYFPPEALKQPRPDPVSAAAISERLLERDVRLADASQAHEMRTKLVGTPDGLLLNTMNDVREFAHRAILIGTEYGTDAVMVGVTAIVDNGEVDGGHKATATLALRVVDTATGDIVASSTRSQSGLGADSQSAAAAAARRMGDVLGQELGDQLFRYWKNRAEKGYEISLRMTGIVHTRLNLAVEDLLRATEGVDGVEQRLYDRNNGVTEYIVTSKVNPTELKGRLLRNFYAQEDFQGLEEEMSLGTNWNFVLRR